MALNHSVILKLKSKGDALGSFVQGIEEYDRLESEIYSEDIEYTYFLLLIPENVQYVDSAFLYGFLHELVDMERINEFTVKNFGFAGGSSPAVAANAIRTFAELWLF